MRLNPCLRLTISASESADGLLKADPDALYAFVTDAKGVPMVHTFGAAFPTDLSAVNPVAVRNRTASCDDNRKSGHL